MGKSRGRKLRIGKINFTKKFSVKVVRSVSSRHVFRGSDWSRASRLDSKKEIIFFSIFQKIRILAI